MTSTRLTRIGLAVLGLASLSSAAAAPRQASVADQGAVAERYYPEVRLRKMHLVRPDLIPYPITFAVYC